MALSKEQKIFSIEFCSQLALFINTQRDTFIRDGVPSDEFDIVAKQTFSLLAERGGPYGINHTRVAKAILDPENALKEMGEL